MFIECGEASACWAWASGSVYIVVVLTPNCEAVLLTLRAISPLFAIRMFLIVLVPTEGAEAANDDDDVVL